MIDTTGDQDEWLDGFCKIHNLNNYEEALDKLIKCYQAWNGSAFHSNQTNGGKQ